MSCAECLCEWCARSFLYLNIHGNIHLLDSVVRSCVADAESLAAQLGFRFHDVEGLALEAECFELIPREVARDIDVIAVDGTQSEITVASPCPARVDLFESLRFSIGRSVVPCLASRDAIHRILSLHPFENQSVKLDPLGNDPTVRRLIRRTFIEAKKETDQYWLSLGDPSSRDYKPYIRHLYRRQKRILDQKFGIAWSSPIDLNPNVDVD
ncbi:MAG: hypothetical protein QGG71_26920 [Pirellulaceae bacterium]|nr:hypothetical protein [Pirellulaceae bacterium]